MIAFVAILAVLTMFSNTIMNATIPKVVASYASRGNLASTNGATAPVVVENSTKILTVDGRTVDKVNVSNYDTVNVGDVLFTLKPVENTDDLTELQTQLTTLQREATYAARTPATDNGVQAARDAVTAAQQTLNDAQNTLTQANGKAATIAAAQQTINDKNAALTAAEAEVTSASATVESLQSQMDQIDTEIAPLQSQVDVYVALGTPTPTPAAAGVTPTPGTSDIEILCAQINAYNAQKAQLQSQVASAQARVDTASAALTPLKTAIEQAQATIDAANSIPSVSSAQTAVNTAQAALTTAQTNLHDTQINAQIAVDKAQDEVTDRNASIATLQQKIAVLQAKVDLTEVKATAAGYVFNVGVATGDVMTANQTAMMIIPEDSSERQCTVSFSFASSVAESLYVGAQLEITSGYMQPCTVVNIKPDPTNPRDMRLVKCTIDGGDAWPDEQVTVKAAQSNKDYDNVIASSAVNEDNTGSFVYVIVGSSSPLGDKYTVKRVTVTVEATNGTLSAISGDGLTNAQIVVRSEKPLEDGDRVRLEDLSSSSNS